MSNNVKQQQSIIYLNKKLLNILIVPIRFDSYFLGLRNFWGKMLSLLVYSLAMGDLDNLERKIKINN
jgi:hypothetical protein